MISKEMQDFWETCHKNFSHIEISGHLKDYNTLTSAWEKQFVERMNFEDAIVLDYGIGGGFLGKYLFENKKIKKYYGVDIAHRSLEVARKNLSSIGEFGLPSGECSAIPSGESFGLLHTDDFYSNFNAEVDIIISQACIQHFVNEEYLKQFLKKINSLNAKYIMLQIAYGVNTTFVKDNPYNSVQTIVRACYTNKSYILKYLTEYNLEYESQCEPSGYQFLIFSKK